MTHEKKGIKLKVWGDYALFSRPEAKVERVSYDIMTPSAARGILESIHWKPSIRWIIRKIHVINPIKFENIRRNEVENKISERNVRQVMTGRNVELYQVATQERQQRASMVLKDVCYVIDACFEMTDNAEPEETEEKHYNIALRRMEKGQCFQNPYFGCKEFPVKFELIRNDEDIPKSFYVGERRPLGLMLWDMDFAIDVKKPPALFFNAEIVDGIITVPTKEELKR